MTIQPTSESVRRTPCRFEWLALVLMFIGCQDDDVRSRQSGTVIEATDKPDSSAPAPSDPECTQDMEAKPCGDSKLNRHCVSGRCISNVCGDGIKASAEECDDGNQSSRDGCSPACQVECDVPELSAEARKLCRGSSSAETCGDGKKAADEECDDGNREARDECSNSCTTNECGNSRLDPDEECDDGNQEDGDGCGSVCLRERCRNGRVDPGEECDDGNQIEHDGCNNRCKVMVCGDGMQQDREECDDGNLVDEDGCSARCTKNECGNGRTDPGEECDGGLSCVACKLQEDLCTPCEEMRCRNYMEANIDFFAGCVENKPDQANVPMAPVPGQFSDPCTEVLACARRTQCLQRTDAPDLAAVGCYCGSADPDTCAQDGPAPDAACASEFLKAAWTQSPVELNTRISNLAYPSGYAYYLLACDVEFCRAECAPWLE